MENKIIPGRNKVSGYAAGGAFAVSLILGFIVKNPAGIVLMRAFFSGLLFGTLVRGGIFILERFIPEIISRQSDHVESAQKVETENMETETVREDKFITVSDDDVEILDGEEIEEIGTDLKSEPETPEEVIPETVTGENETVEGEPSDLEELEEIDEEEEAFSELPELDSLFEEGQEEIIDAEENISKRPENKSALAGDYIEIGNAQIPNEPETIAKAIRKVIKQE